VVDFGGREWSTLGVEGACFEDTFGGAFHECLVGVVFEIMVHDGHAFHGRVKVVVLDVVVTDSIFKRLDVFEGGDGGGLVEARFRSKDL
jgi:hypothetical protein